MIAQKQTVQATLLVILFATAFAFVESSIVLYLRAIYYPEGFRFPLKLVTRQHLVNEVAREVATIVMLGAVALIAGRRGWEKFGYFLIGFGVWDVMYYVWLKVVLDWPHTLFDWDVLFLIPLPWIGPVIAPLLVALVMTGCGCMLVFRVSSGKTLHFSLFGWAVSVTGTALLCYSFLSDTSATLGGELPAPYRYDLLGLSLVLYLVGCTLGFRGSSVQPGGS